MIINAIENYEEISPFDEMTVGEGFPLPTQKVVVFLTNKNYRSQKNGREDLAPTVQCASRQITSSLLTLTFYLKKAPRFRGAKC